MASDLIERLRNAIYRSDPVIPELTDEAADALAAQAAEIERLRTTSRWNIEASDDGDVLVCRGEHEKNQKCEYEQWVPKARADALAARVAELEAALLEIARMDRGEISIEPKWVSRVALTALHPKAPAPAGEGGAS